jgi:hypothetical protein
VVLAPHVEQHLGAFEGEVRGRGAAQHMGSTWAHHGAGHASGALLQRMAHHCRPGAPATSPVQSRRAGRVGGGRSLPGAALQHLARS